MKYLFVFLTLLTFSYASCTVPSSLKSIVTKVTLSHLTHSKDVQRNLSSLKKLCLYKVSFNEGKYHWRMLLVTHPKHSKGPFWYLPHDDENTAFDAAVYATKKYGGGFLAVLAQGKRNMQGQDPNRNFGTTPKAAKTCKKQQAPSPKYVRNVFKIIDTYRHTRYPYFALHNNKNAWHGNGGSGAVSIFNSSAMVHSHRARHRSKISPRFKDEDTLVYIAGASKSAPKKKLRQLLNLGVHVKYEVVNEQTNDCSLSNYVVLRKKTERYLNLEAEHHDLTTQKTMIDKILKQGHF